MVGIVNAGDYLDIIRIYIFIENERHVHNH